MTPAQQEIRDLKLALAKCQSRVHALETAIQLHLDHECLGGKSDNLRILLNKR